MEFLRLEMIPSPLQRSPTHLCMFLSHRQMNRNHLRKIPSRQNKFLILPERIPNRQRKGRNLCGPMLSQIEGRALVSRSMQSASGLELSVDS